MDGGEAETEARGDGSIGRVFDVLDLFTPELGVVRVEDVTGRLGYTRSTAYRYLKSLCNAGLLAPMGNGAYSLGPRIVELERLMHLTDPLLRAGEQALPGLADAFPNSIVLLSSLYRDKVLCVHKAGPQAIRNGGRSLQILRARGLPMPLFRGAASLVILAFLPPHRIRALFLARQAEMAREGLGRDWAAVRARLAAIRREGHVTTAGLFNPDLAAVAVPILACGGSQVLGSLTRIMAASDHAASDREAVRRDLAAGALRMVPSFS